jgi:hypothetical protein
MKTMSAVLRKRRAWHARGIEVLRNLGVRSVLRSCLGGVVAQALRSLGEDAADESVSLNKLVQRVVASRDEARLMSLRSLLDSLQVKPIPAPHYTLCHASAHPFVRRIIQHHAGVPLPMAAEPHPRSARQRQAKGKGFHTLCFLLVSAQELKFLGRVDDALIDLARERATSSSSPSIPSPSPPSTDADPASGVIVVAPAPSDHSPDKDKDKRKEAKLLLAERLTEKASTLQTRGNWAEALRLLEEVLSLQQEVQGGDSQAVGELRAKHLGWLLHEMGQYERALREAEQGKEVRSL